MSDYANDVRRYGADRKYPKRVDQIIRHQFRREATAIGDATFQIAPDDANVVINTGDSGVNGVANLPPLRSVKRGQTIIIQNCDPSGVAGTTLTINPDGADLINEAAGALTINGANVTRKLTRGLSNAVDSWYTMCCYEEAQEPV